MNSWRMQSLARCDQQHSNVSEDFLVVQILVLMEQRQHLLVVLPKHWRGSAVRGEKGLPTGCDADAA